MKFLEAQNVFLRKNRIPRGKDIVELLEYLLAYTNTWVLSTATHTQMWRHTSAVPTLGRR